VVARDGRLLDVAVVRSSGVPEIDGAAVAILRQASPYAPLPAEIPGASATFTLPLTAGPMGY
jgi:protein TonB